MEPVIIVDIETDGLKVEDGHTILELGAMHLDLEKLVILRQFHRLVYKNDPEASMDTVVRQMHTENGLIAAVQRAPARGSVCADLAELDHDFTDWLIKCGAQAGSVLFCGSSIHFDAKFIDKLLPSSAAQRHYRLLDARSIKIVAETWTGTSMPAKTSTHRALNDCQHVVETLRWSQEAKWPRG